jgi:hypothetical protein
MKTLLDSKKLKSAPDGEVKLSVNEVSLISSISSLLVLLISNVLSEFVSNAGVKISKGRLIPVEDGITTV